ncbi:MAG: four helix bundle protein [Fidelibacterota bacterium]
MKNFKKLQIWQQGMELVKKVNKLSKSLPSSEKYGLTNQITRATVSIPSNIAEGSSRNSEKDYQHFLQIALGSSFEVETQLLIMQKLEMVPKQAVRLVMDILIPEQKMINSLISKLNQ